jgi:hypothetical protein
MGGVCGCADPKSLVSMAGPATGQRRGLRDGGGRGAGPCAWPDARASATTEGEDRALNYQQMFRSVGLVVINKTTFARRTGVDEPACRARIVAVKPKAEIISLSSRTRDNLSARTDLLPHLRDRARNDR